MKHLSFITVITLTTLVMGDTSSGRQSLNRRNPFAPLAEAASSTTEQHGKISVSKEGSLHLNGIIWNKHSPMAIINDTVVKVGSEISGRKVAAISAGHVALEYRGKKEILRITPKILFSIVNKKSDGRTGSKTRP